MPSWRPTQVVCRAEGRADQRPLEFLLDDEWIPVTNMRATWLETGQDPNQAVWRMFDVDGPLGRFYLRVEEGGESWEIRSAR